MYVAALWRLRMAGREDLIETMASLPEVGNWVIGHHESFAKEIRENLDFDRSISLVRASVMD
jgi:hypothetical protein